MRYSLLQFLHVKEHAIIPGKAEALTVIVDCNIWAVSAPTGLMKKMIGVLQNHFPGSLYKLFAIHLGFASRTVAKTILAFANPFTKEKINIYGDDFEDDLHSVISCSKLEPKFGGYYSRKQSHYYPPEFS